MNRDHQSDVARADALRRATDGVESEYWAGFLRGLRRAHHGATFGTEAEHALWESLAGSSDETRDARGRGYGDGLAGRWPRQSDADRLRATLDAAGLSQRGAARALDIDERTMRRYCAGELPVPRLVWLALDGLKGEREST